MTPWWAGLAAVETAGPTGAPGHRLSWRDGALHLVAHPDPDADRALAAFGGDVCPCLDLLDAWDDAHVTGSFLVLGARRAEEQLSAPAAAIDAIAADLARWRGARAGLLADARAAQDGDLVDRLSSRRSPEEAAARGRLAGLVLLTMDRRLQHRLQASVAAALAARGDAAALTVATAVRAAPSLRGVGWSGTLADVCLGGPPRIDGEQVILPPTWVSAVWGRGVAGSVPDHVVLDVTSVTPEGRLTVLAAAPGKRQVEIGVDRWENA